MKLFFASDIHGCFDSAQRMITAFERSEATQLILLGDVLNHGPRNAIPDGYAPIDVAKLLNCYADKIIAVRGNCDSEVDQALLDFPMMADYNLVLLESGRRLFLTHGHRYDIEQHPRLADGDIFASGHVHLPIAESHGALVAFNPGSVSIPRQGYPASYGLLDGNELRVLAFNGEVLAQHSL